MIEEVNEKQDEPRAYECTFYADPEEPFLSFEPISSGTNIPLYTKPQPRKRVLFPTMLRKMWSGGEVQAWLDENVNKE